MSNTDEVTQGRNGITWRLSSEEKYFKPHRNLSGDSYVPYDKDKRIPWFEYETINVKFFRDARIMELINRKNIAFSHITPCYFEFSTGKNYIRFNIYCIKEGRLRSAHAYFPYEETLENAINSVCGAFKD